MGEIMNNLPGALLLLQKLLTGTVFILGRRGCRSTQKIAVLVDLNSFNDEFGIALR